ncbi:MAG TPA: L-glutamate gamma-semialdehyde dehydrogenase [Gemmatimonadales bacterium]|nr:L-glutamate gamma-semialdehyde dehydrogenase [Gemmatimonadales bacterium]
MATGRAGRHRDDAREIPMNGSSNVPAPRNEPVLSYAPGTPERTALKAELKRLGGTVTEIPGIVNGQEVRGTRTVRVVSPHRHSHHLANTHQADARTIAAAITAAKRAHREWASWSFEDRAGVFLKAAELLAGPWRQVLNASTMLGQSKTVFQAEIDSACELIDFFRYNAHFAERVYAEQPISSAGMWNRMEHRPLEGFVYAVTPFNFTAIGGNLPTAPALMGNTVVWKPAATAALSNYMVMRLLMEAGLPPGVINFIPGDSAQISERVLSDRSLAGIHFTGSTAVFQSLWKGVASRLESYASYPRLVGETGGKDFILAHPSGDADAIAVAMVRGAFEYQGQKCSAASRAYIPQGLWPAVKKRVLEMIAEIRMGDVADFRNFMGAVIDAKSFAKLSGYLDRARKDRGVTILAGGGADDKKGWFIEPTLLQVKDPQYRTMCEELFGPVLTVYVYPDKAWKSTLSLVNSTSPYALTGAVFAQERGALVEATAALRFAAGNFYLNDKPTGAVVAQQPFGGARASGTNDKAGSVLNLQRWVSPRSIKETFDPPHTHRYPFMDAE